LGMGVGGVVYLLLAYRSVRAQAATQESLLREEGLLPA
jgi:hypothetical protein